MTGGVTFPLAFQFFGVGFLPASFAAELGQAGRVYPVR